MERDFKNAQIILGLAFNSNYIALSLLLHCGRRNSGDLSNHYVPWYKHLIKIQK